MKLFNCLYEWWDVVPCLLKHGDYANVQNTSVGQFLVDIFENWDYGGSRVQRLC